MTGELYDNLTMTFISIVIALLIGGLEALGLAGSKLGLEGKFWDFIGQANENLGLLGYLIVGVFLASWMISVLIHRLRRFDETHGDDHPIQARNPLSIY